MALLNVSVGRFFVEIDFFNVNGKFDNRAVNGGVYKVELFKNNKKDPLCLYIGESVWMASRCGRHLYAQMQNSNYFGLTANDMSDNSLTLKFSVVEVITKTKKDYAQLYKDKELDAIKKYKPITQGDSGDKQSRLKLEKVQKAIKNWQ